MFCYKSYSFSNEFNENSNDVSTHDKSWNNDETDEKKKKDRKMKKWQRNKNTINLHIYIKILEKRYDKMKG